MKVYQTGVEGYLGRGAAVGLQDKCIEYYTLRILYGQSYNVLGLVGCFN